MITQLRDHKQADIAQKNITDLSKVLTAETRYVDKFIYMQVYVLMTTITDEICVFRTSTKPIKLKKAPIKKTKSMPSQERNHDHHSMKKRLKFGREETQTLKLS